MSDVNGPRGGIDKHCQVALKTDVAGTVIVASMATDWSAALNKALAKAARFLTRALRQGAYTGRVRQRGSAVPVEALPGVAGPDTPALMRSATLLTLYLVQ
jgi:hypothetical protein